MSQVLKNLPNILTVSRIVLAPVFFILFIYGYYNSAFICFFIASMTDVLDGFLARRFNLVSNFGKLYDPLADKILIFLGFVCIFVFVPDFNLSDRQIDQKFISVVIASILNLDSGTIIYIILSILIIRDLIVTALREEKLRQDNIILKTSFIAKIKTFMVFVSIHFHLLYYIIYSGLQDDRYSYLVSSLLCFEICLYLTLVLSLWSLIDYIFQYRNKNI